MRRRAALFAALFLTSLSVVSAATFIVDSTDDFNDNQLGNGVCRTNLGTCSLRAALAESNESPHPVVDLITFAIPGASVQSIVPLAELPLVLTPVTIDGTTQGCAAPHVCIELVGSNTTGAIGLRLAGGNSTVRGLAIGSYNDGIVLSTGSGNFIVGNHVGTDATGTVARGNVVGIRIGNNSGGNVIGGAAPEDGNLIAANSDGIFFSFAGDNNQVLGNVIGGDTAIPAEMSNQNGIRFIGVGSQFIGAPGAGNVISGNTTGIRMSGSNVFRIVVRSNCIGPIQGCTVPFGNIQAGISIVSSPDNTIGGAGSGEGNVIGGNQTGIRISGDFANGNRALGNFIGTDETGMLELPNTFGFEIFGGADSNQVGGEQPGEGNVIAFNDFAGVRVASSQGNSVLGNSIRANEELGIDIGAIGVLRNDPGDFDDDANGGQNFPLLTGASSNGTQLLVEGSLDSAADSGFRLEFFASDSCDPSGHGEGATYLGAFDVVTDAGGLAAFSELVPGIAFPGDVVTATATALDGSTSEFSECLTVVGGDAFGACCVASGCGISTESQCDGAYQGDGSTCDEDPCAQPVPAVGPVGALVTLLLVIASGGLIIRRGRRPLG